MTVWYGAVQCSKIQHRNCSSYSTLNYCKEWYSSIKDNTVLDGIVQYAGLRPKQGIQGKSGDFIFNQGKSGNFKVSNCFISEQ